MLKNYFTGLLLFFSPLFLLAGNLADNENAQRKRFAFGIIPALAFDSDLGFKYGGVFNFFDFGENGQPPHYNQYLMVRITNTTKGTLNAQALLESETLIPKSKVLAEASYFVDKKLDFFGFNGTSALYHKAFTEPGEVFISDAFYAHRRNLLRLRFDVQKYITGSRFRLLTGFTFNRFITEPAQNTDHSSNQTATLFENYRDWGLIDFNEYQGGNIGLFSLGLVYDSRNDPCYCTDGKWIDAVWLYSPGFLSDHSFSKFILTYRQHSSFLNEKITLSFRLSNQQKLSGNIPFYYLPTFYDSRVTHDGVGGAFNMRGAMRNRIAADGFVTGSFELKFKTLDFSLLRHYFSASLSAFYDNALVTQPRNLNIENVPAEQRTIHFLSGKQKLHHTFGPGLYIVFNQNNVVTVNYGIPANKQLGQGGFYIGSSLLF